MKELNFSLNLAEMTGKESTLTVSNIHITAIMFQFSGVNQLFRLGSYGAMQFEKTNRLQNSSYMFVLQVMDTFR